MSIAERYIQGSFVLAQTREQSTIHHPRLWFPVATRLLGASSFDSGPAFLESATNTNPRLLSPALSFALEKRPPSSRFVELRHPFKGSDVPGV